MRKRLLIILACGLLASAGCTSAVEQRTFSEDGKTAVAYQETLLETQNKQTEQIAAQATGGTLGQSRRDCQSVWVKSAERFDSIRH